MCLTKRSMQPVFRGRFPSNFTHTDVKKKYTHTLTFPLFLLASCRGASHTLQALSLCLSKEPHSAADAIGQAVACWDNVQTYAANVVMFKCSTESLLSMNSNHFCVLPCLSIVFTLLSKCRNCSAEARPTNMRFNNPL